MNTLKTTMLLALLTALLVFIGGLIGGIGGAAIFLVLAGAMNFFAYWFSDKMALKMAGAHEVSESQEPHLHNMIREVANLAGMPMPRVYVVETGDPECLRHGPQPATCCCCRHDRHPPDPDRPRTSRRDRPRNGPCPQSRHPHQLDRCHDRRWHLDDRPIHDVQLALRQGAKPEPAHLHRHHPHRTYRRRDDPDGYQPDARVRG